MPASALFGFACEVQVSVSELAWPVFWLKPVPAAIALIENTNLSAREIVEKSMKIAADVCIYTNENITFEELG